ncbi:MAG TPA: hypothetical protein VFO60_10240 [Candidatus Dormibacteraeota bacterium]|nr:hypothetical protein [Candidatus Dormibacteraeota bacterium]
MRRSIALVVAGLAGSAVAACGSGSSSSGSSASATGGGGGDYCTLARAVKDSTGALNAVFTATDAASIKRSLASLYLKFEAAASAAPSEIAPAWAIEKQAFAAVNGAVQNATDVNGVGSSINSVETASSALSTAADAASTQIDTYTKSHCGFTISTQSSSASTVESSSGSTSSSSASS